MKVLVRTPLSAYSGYGNDGIGLVNALCAAGLDVYLDPTHVSAPLPASLTALLTKRLQAPFDLLIHHADPGALGISVQARRACTTTVAWSMWETTSLDNLRGRRTLRRRLRDYDLVLGYDTVSTGALAPYVTGRSGTLQGGFFPDDWPRVDRDWHSPRFGFCMLGQLHQRKDPFTAINAFKELKDEHPDRFDGAELHLKTNMPGLHSAMQEWVPKLRVHYSVWPIEVVREFYHAQHCLLAPSRGEGKNMPALEFQATGGVVAATDWGGHQQWLSPAWGYPLRYTLAPIAPDTPDCRNARVDKEHLKQTMWHVYTHRDEARAKGLQAATVIPAMCAWNAVLPRLFDLLAERVPDGGRLAHTARTAARATPLGSPVPANA